MVSECFSFVDSGDNMLRESKYLVDLDFEIFYGMRPFNRRGSYLEILVVSKFFVGEGYKQST